MEPRKPTLDNETLARRIADLTLDKKALDVVVLNLQGKSSYTDFLVIASGTSDRHVQAVAEFVEDELRREHCRPVGTEGFREGQWALLDYGGVVTHVFHQFTREVYDLEGLWSGAERIRLVPKTVSHSR